MVQAAHGAMAEAAATLKLLVELYHETERRLNVAEEASDGSSAATLREQALQARVNELERRIVMLSEAFLEIDLLENA
jgi:hypothetical protein